MKKLLIFILIFISYANFVKGNEFFQDITYQVLDNQPRLSYGVSVTDANNDGKFEFIVTGFGFNNLAKLLNPNPVTINSNFPSLFASVTETP